MINHSYTFLRLVLKKRQSFLCVWVQRITINCSHVLPKDQYEVGYMLRRPWTVLSSNSLKKIPLGSWQCDRAWNNKMFSIQILSRCWKCAPSRTLLRKGSGQECIRESTTGCWPGHCGGILGSQSITGPSPQFTCNAILDTKLSTGIFIKEEANCWCSSTSIIWCSSISIIQSWGIQSWISCWKSGQ